MLQAVETGEQFLDFEADDMPAKGVADAAEPFATGKGIRTGGRRYRGGDVLIIDQGWDEDFATVLSEAPGELAFGCKAWSQAGDLLRRLVSVRDCHNAGDGGPARQQQEAFAGYARENRPSDGKDGE
jgi:hypothetical protein